MSKVAQIKTQANDASVDTFVAGINENQRADCKILIELMQKGSGEPPKMWGKSIIGFGIKRYKSPATGREVDWFKIGFSPRKANLSLHLVLNMETHKELLGTLGKHKTGVGCLYINTLSDVDLKVLEQLIKHAMEGK